MKRVLCLILLGTVSSTARALPNYARLYKEKYGYLPNCSVCHKLQDWRMNDYGEAFEGGGRALAALEAADGKDSDGDGVKNGEEARARANPGDPHSTPKRPGDWLKDAAVRPPSKRLAKAFPRHKDAEVLMPALDDAGRRTLEAFGDEALFPVVFAVKDAEGRRIGSAMYVSYDLPEEGSPMVLVMADDARALTAVEFVHHAGGSAVKDARFLEGFRGRTLETLGDGPAAPPGAAADAKALAQGVRKALSVFGVLKP